MKEYYSYRSADREGTAIHAVKWAPEGEPVAVMQLVHGMIEYIERYSEFAEFLVSKGFVVMGHDHIGHGESVRDRSDWGVFHTDTPSETCVEDIFSNYKIIKEQYPDIPYFLLGHSMGSYLIRHMLTIKSAEFKGVNGVIIMGTGTVEESTCKAGMAVLNIIKTFRGWDSPAPKFVINLMYDAPYKGFSTDGSDPAKSWLSTNVESVKKYLSDPKDNFVFSLNGYRLLITSAGFSGRMDNIERIDKSIPILFVSGEQDPVGGLGTGVTAAYNKYKSAGIRDVSIHLFPGDRHEILNEMDRFDVYDYIYDWIKKRL